jgi:bifunctional DNA primase/polymerase-like protein
VTDDIAASACAYVQRGWKVIQLHDVTNLGVCSCYEGPTCESAGKHPLARAWQLNFLSTVTDVINAWSARPRANVGIVTGPPSGIWVLDVDPIHGGPARLADLELQNGPLPKTYTVRTGSGGLHLYFSLDGIDFDLTNAKGTLPPGLDVRGRGGFVVAPPSISGRGRYSLMSDPDSDVARFQ